MYFFGIYYTILTTFVFERLYVSPILKNLIFKNKIYSDISIDCFIPSAPHREP